MASKFKAYKYNDAKKAIDEAHPLTYSYAPRTLGASNDLARQLAVYSDSSVAWSMYRGDHWMNGTGWTGPIPGNRSTNAQEIMLQIQRGFVSRNVIKEVVDRHVGGLLGRQPRWLVRPERKVPLDEEPTDDEKKQIDQAETLLSAWADKRALNDVLQQALARALVTDSAIVRLFIPKGLLTQTESPTGPVFSLPRLDIDKALDIVFIEAPERCDAAVETDRDTMTQASFYRSGDGPAATIEMSFVDGELTYLRLYAAADPKGEPVAEASISLDGQLMAHELRLSDALVSPQIVTAQKALNLALSMMQRNSILGGFLERVILNAQPPGDWVDDAQSPGGKRFVPSGTLDIGAGKTTFLESKMVEGEDGIRRPAPVDIRYRDPVDPKTLIDTAETHYRNVLFEAHQGHVAMTGDGSASAVSRVQARADFANSLTKTKPFVDAVVNWVLTTAMALAAAIAQEPDAFNLVRPMVDVKPDSGPLTPEEAKTVKELCDAGLISQETAMVLIGLEDPDAEKSLISVEDKDLSFDRELEAVDRLAKVGFTLTDEQQAWWDGRLGWQKRDLAQIALDKEQALAAQQELARQRTVQGNPNDNPQPPAQGPQGG